MSKYIPVDDGRQRNDTILATEGSAAARSSILVVSGDDDSIVSHVLRFSSQGPQFLVCVRLIWCNTCGAEL